MKNPGEHYFSPSPSVASRPGRIQLTLPDVHVELAVDRGVFSGDAVDPGTKLLLQESPPPPSGDVLDLGCGYGPIAVVVALRTPGAQVWAIDVNERALDLTRANAAAAGVGDRVTCTPPDGVPADVRFVALYSNPPIRIGKPALHELLLTWLSRLREDGRARLVVHKNLGADSLARWLDAEGFATQRLVSRMGYRLLEVSPCGR